MMASNTTNTPLRDNGGDQNYGTTSPDDQDRSDSPGSSDSRKGSPTIQVNEQSQSPSKEDDSGDAVTTVTDDVAPKDSARIEKSDIEPGSRCGWFGCSPSFIQVFNNAKGYAFFLCMLSFFQSMTAFGLVYTMISTLERRFGLTSFQSSFISSSYEFSTLAFSLIVTYVGERGHKPRWVGMASAIFSLGSIIFAIPHFVTGVYEPAGDTTDDLCHLHGNGTDGCDSDGGDSASDSDLSNVYWIFIVAQLLQGIGGAPLNSLGVTYLDENLSAADFGLYLGFFNACSTAGPALGSILAGVYLLIYTDFNVKDSGSLTPSNPLWVGAWWLGFLINGGVIFITSLLMLGYPQTLPGSDEIAREREDEVQSGQEFESGIGWKERLKGLPRAFLNLVTNIPFMCLSLFITCEFFTLATAVFGPKYFESQFNYSSSDAAFYTGILNLVGVMSGALIGGAIIKKFDPKFKGLTVFSIICTLFTLGLSFGFWLTCPNVPMAGITVEYSNSSIEIHSDPNITAMCNKNCSCGTSYDPVCGSDDVLYYSPCHAGCVEQPDETLYSDCSCISNSSGSSLGTAVEGKCSIFCSSTRPYFAVLFLQLLFSGMVIVPAWTATLRCLPFSQRNFGLGLQNIMYSALGTIPGPVILGSLIDKSCLVWETFCDGTQVCWMYENSNLAFVFFLFVFVAKLCGLAFVVGALLGYKSPEVKEDDDGNYAKFENEVASDGV